MQIGEGPLKDHPDYQVESGSILLITFSILVLAGAVVVSIILLGGMDDLDAAGLAKAANCGRLSHQAYETRTLACDTTFADQGYETAQACKDAIPHYWSEAAGCVMFPGAPLPASWPPRRLSLLNS